MQSDRYDLGYPANDRVTACEAGSIPGTIAESDNPFRARRRMKRALQRLAHILGHGASNKQHIGMPRRGDETNAKSLEIVNRVVEGVDLKLAAVAGPGVYLADCQAAAQASARGAIEASCELIHCRVAHRWRRLGERRAKHTLEEQLAHLEIVARIGTVERFVAEREVSDDVALDCGFQERPLKPRRVPQMAPFDPAVTGEPDPNQYVTAKALD